MDASPLSETAWNCGRNRITPSRVGLYRMTAYMVTRRTREIGIRMALGATRGKVMVLVVREVAVLTAAGVAIGVPAALAAACYAWAALHAIGPTEVVSIAAAACAWAPGAADGLHSGGARGAGDSAPSLRWETNFIRFTGRGGSGPWLYALNIARQSRRISYELEQYTPLPRAPMDVGWSPQSPTPTLASAASLRVSPFVRSVDTQTGSWPAPARVSVSQVPAC